MTRALRALLAVAAVGLVAVIGFPGTASAHVTVSGDATQGGFSRVAFRVPNESDTATTTKLEVFLPDGQPIAYVSTMPVVGWTVAVQKKKLDKPVIAEGGEITEVVSSIVWTAAAGSEVRQNQFQEFPVSMGQLPKVDKLVFKALQTYSDGNVVRWIEEPGTDGKEAEHPAPTLALKPAAAASSASPQVSSERPAGGAGDDDAEGADWVAVAGLVAGLGGLALGALALGLGGVALARTRRG